MRAILKKFAELSRPRTAGVWIAPLCVLALSLGATAAAAQLPEPLSPIVLNQTTWQTAFPNGGALAGEDPAGSSIAVNQNGDVIVGTSYGGSLVLFNGQTGAATTLGSWGNIAGVTVDSQNNIYASDQYTFAVIKVPYVNGAYVTFNSATTTNCTGTDTTACLLPNLGSNADGYYDGFASIAFDAAGDFFFATGSTGNEKYAIFETPAADVYGSGGNTVLLYQEATAGSPATTGQLTVGALAIDPWGNLFFTDSAYYGSNNESFSSNLKELAYSGTAYAPTPTTLYTLTPATPAAYDDQLAAVAVDSNGTVYFATEYDGTFGFPNNAGVVDNSKVYGIANQGAKILALDGKGNLFIAAYSNTLSSDAVLKVLVNNVTVPASTVGIAATATNVTVLDNAGGCGTTPAFTFAATENGVPSMEFAGAVTAPGTCVSQLGGSAFPLTITFTPTKVGARSAELWVNDTVNSAGGWSSASGVGNGPLLTLDPGVWTSYASGFTYPAGVAVDAAGDLVVADGNSGNVFELPASSSTWVSIGTGFSNPQSVAFDAGSNLYVADASTNVISEILNTSISGGFTAGTTETLLPATATFDGTKLSEPQGLAVGPDGVLYITDNGNNRVVSYNTSSGITGVRAAGLHSPTGVAVDGAGTVYVSNSSSGTVSVLAGDTITSLSSITGIASPWGIAVDASGSVVVGDAASGAIVRIPNESGTLTIADAIAIEANPSTAYGIALDTWGNLYTSDTTAQAVYAIQRTAGAVNFAVSVTDGTTSSAETLTLESAGNTAVTLGTPAVTGLTGPFTEATGSPNPCTDGSSGPAGKSCELAVTFAPTGVETGAQSGSFVVNSNALNAAAETVNLSGTATNVAKTPQAIIFTAPTSPQTYAPGLTIMLVATGGGSGNPIVFTVDGSSTGSGSITGNVLTVTNAGTLVIDANQAGNATYSAAPQVQQSVVITGIAQAITLASQASPIVISGYPIVPSATATPAIPKGSTGAGNPASGNSIVFTIDASSTATWYACPVSQTTTQVPCYGTNEYVITSPGTLVIDANLAGGNGYTAAPQVQQSILIYAVAPTATISSPDTLTIGSAGGSGSITISITPSIGWTAPITFSASNLPTGATATFSPASVTPNGTNPLSTQLTITTAAASAMLHRNSNPLIPGGTALAFALCFIGFRKRRKIQMLLLLMVSVAGFGMFTGCSSNPPTTTTVTITATSVLSSAITVEQFKDIQLIVK